MKAKTDGNITINFNSVDNSYGFISSGVETISTSQQWLQMRLNFSSLIVQYGPIARIQSRDTAVSAAFDIGVWKGCSSRITSDDGAWVEVLGTGNTLDNIQTIPDFNVRDNNLLLKWNPDSVEDTLEVVLEGSNEEVRVLWTSTELTITSPCGTNSHSYTGGNFVVSMATELIVYDMVTVTEGLLCSQDLTSSDTLSVKLAINSVRRTNLVGLVHYTYSTKTFCPLPQSPHLAGSWFSVPALSSAPVSCTDPRYQPLLDQVACTWEGAWAPREPDCVLKTCPTGQELQEDGWCHSCQPGTFHNATTGKCDICPRGSFSVREGAGECIECNVYDSVVDASGTLCIQTGVPRTQTDKPTSSSVYLYTLLGVGLLNLVMGLSLMAWQFYRTEYSQGGTFEKRWKRYNRPELFPRKKVSQRFIYPDGLVEINTTKTEPPASPVSKLHSPIPTSPPPKIPSPPPAMSPPKLASSPPAERLYDSVDLYDHLAPTTGVIPPSYSEDNYMQLNSDNAVPGPSDNYMEMVDKRASYADVTIDSKGVTRVQPKGSSSIYTKASLLDKDLDAREWWEEEEDNPPAFRSYILSDNGDTSV